MLKREITYEDWDGETVTDIFYFNLSKPELIEMDVEHDAGLQKFIQRIIDTKDHKELIKQFKDLVLLTYGERSADGKLFVKNDELREKFSQTAAYPVLFMELSTNEGAAADFLKGVLPRDMVSGIEAALSSAPPAPTV